MPAKQYDILGDFGKGPDGFFPAITLAGGGELVGVDVRAHEAIARRLDCPACQGFAFHSFQRPVVVAGGAHHPGCPRLRSGELATATSGAEVVGSLFGSITHAISHAVSSAAHAVVHGVTDAAHALDHAYKSVAPTWLQKGLSTITHIVAAPATFFWDTANAIADGKRIDDALIGGLKAQADAWKQAAPFIQAGLSFVPGIGQGVSAAIGAGLALAEGKKITDALIDSVKGALPGGPLVGQTFDAAAKIGVDLAQGRNIGDAALEQLRNQVPGGELGKLAFDSGLALAHGKKLQDIGMAAAEHYLPASPIAHAAFEMTQRALAGQPLAGSTQAAMKKSEHIAHAIKQGAPPAAALLAARKKAADDLEAQKLRDYGTRDALQIAAVDLYRKAHPKDAHRKWPLPCMEGMNANGQCLEEVPGFLQSHYGTTNYAQVTALKGYRKNYPHDAHRMWPPPCALNAAFRCVTPPPPSPQAAAAAATAARLAVRSRHYAEGLALARAHAMRVAGTAEIVGHDCTGCAEAKARGDTRTGCCP
jgi:hypothetical protein